ncbi:MAG: glycerol-3-phosphate dehydrogenase, partial [Rhodospirillales bacterium]|nr:glycerol-3-phosphate dehydrogenase [Rhodospirillales bacterium]
VEQGDLAGATSSASTKLIHGGLRYLEQYAFRLVREALTERAVLLAALPHIAWPMRFVLPHHAGLRPWWMLRAGLFLYDHLGRRSGALPGTATLDLTRDPAGLPLRPEFRRAFEYSDAWVDDARLVVLAARDAAARGAAIRTRTRCVSARVADGMWQLALAPAGGPGETATARVLVNAAGPWSGSLLDGVLHRPPRAVVRLVKGAHIVVPRLFQHDRCYIFQNKDGRICFAIPYEGDFTLIGTTDEDYRGDPAKVVCTEGDVAYLCAAVGEYLRDPPKPADVVWRYAGVRPLHQDGSASAQETSRDYVLELDHADGAPLLSVYGGKITTFRRLAEHAMERLGGEFPGLGRAWTASAPLPGGQIARAALPALQARLAAAHPDLDAALIARLVRAYGSDAPAVLGDGPAEAMGPWFGPHLCACEVAWMMAREWAMTAEDVLWRRSKLGLRLTPDQQAALAAWMAGRNTPGR